MKNILIVDDEKSFADSLAEGLTAYDKDLQVITAENGKVAVQSLETTKIDVVLTDLKMPEMDGFGLLAYLNRNHRDVPVIIMTAFSTPEIEKSLNGLGIHQYLEKPLEFNTLVEKIYTALSKGKEGFIKGISLPTFLQFVEVERNTCTIKIHSKDRLGFLYFQSGQLMDAEFGSQQGLEAALDIIGWDETDIRMDNVCKAKDKRIAESLSHILLESFRLKDEQQRNGDNENVTEINDVPEREEVDPVALVEIDTEQIIDGGNEMSSAKEILQELVGVSGVKTAVVVGRDGFVIDGVSNGGHMETETVGAVISAGIGSSEVMGRELNVGMMNQGMMEYSNGLIMMSLIGNDAILAVVADTQANLGYVRLQIKRRLPDIENVIC
jgi:DNA-binding response OmpR family regulator/predicted regulator of Ras-like GTPase activity (Roadblock/LC7/MglB family)